METPSMGEAAYAAAFEPTKEQRRIVRTMAGFGLPEQDIAVLVRLALPVLREHFRGELELGAAEGTAKVAQSLFAMATRDGNVSAAIFWMKARAGWRDRQTGDGPAGEPEEPVTSIVYRWMTPEEVADAPRRAFQREQQKQVRGRAHGR